MTDLATIWQLRNAYDDLLDPLSRVIIDHAERKSAYRPLKLEDKLHLVLSDRDHRLLELLDSAGLSKEGFLWRTAVAIRSEYRLQRSNQTPVIAIARKCVGEGRHSLLSAVTHELAMQGNPDAELLTRLCLVMQAVDSLGPDFEMIVAQLISQVRNGKLPPEPLEDHVLSVSRVVRHRLPQIDDPEELVRKAFRGALLFLYELAHERHDGDKCLSRDFIYAEVLRECRHLVMTAVQNILH